jgi:hypothetical protein
MRWFVLRVLLVSLALLLLVLASAPIDASARSDVTRPLMRGPASGMNTEWLTPGAQVWVARYNGPADGGDVGRSVAMSPDGTRVFVTGDSWGGIPGTANDYGTIAYDAGNGAKLWIRLYIGPGGNENKNDHAASVAVSPDGARVFVTGRSAQVSGAPYDFATLAYDSVSGDQLWVSRYSGSWDDEAYALAVSPDGAKVFVTGRSDAPGGHLGYGTVAYDSRNGTQLWARSYNGVGNGADVSLSLSPSPDGSKLFVTGWSDGFGFNRDYATIAYDTVSGAQLWVSRYNGPENSVDEAASVIASSDGSKVFVTGHSWSGESFADYATIAYDASSGAELWLTRYNGPGGYETNDDYATSLAVSPDGSKVFVTGTSHGPGSSNNRDYATVAYNAGSGAQLWVMRYSRSLLISGDDQAFSLALSPDGSRVFVTGASAPPPAGCDEECFPNYDYATVAYDAGSGVELWDSVYRGPSLVSGEDVAFSLAVSPDDVRVFVTGVSWGDEQDYATVAYSTG